MSAVEKAPRRVMAERGPSTSGGGSRPVPMVAARTLSRREAIRVMADAGATPAEIARRYAIPVTTVERILRQMSARPRPVTPAPKDAVAEWLRDALRAPSCSFARCPVCGSAGPLERHHVVRRSQGGGDGPTVTLCRDCHMAVHAQRLHLRWVPVASTSYGIACGSVGGGHWEFLRAEGKTFDLLGELGWRRLGARGSDDEG